jgi:hypothetical protein
VFNLYDGDEIGQVACLVVTTGGVEAEGLDGPIGVTRFHTAQPWRKLAPCWCGRSHAPSDGSDMTVFVGPVDNQIHGDPGSFKVWLAPAGSDIENLPFSAVVAREARDFGQWARSVLRSMLSPTWEPGLICVDFADILTVLGGRQKIEYFVARTNVGVEHAARTLTGDPAFVTGENYLVCIRGTTDLDLIVVSEACNAIYAAIPPDTNIVLAAIVDADATMDEVAVFVCIERNPRDSGAASHEHSGGEGNGS